MNYRRIFVMAQNVFQEVVRDRILYMIAFYGLLLALGMRVISAIADTTKEKIFLDFGLSAMNVMGLIVAIFLGTGMINKEIEKRTLLVLIAKPISRSEFIISKYLGLSAVLGVIMATMTAIYLGFLQLNHIHYSTESIFIAVIFLFLQLTLVIAVAITLGVFTGTILATVLTFAVYLMGNITPNLVKLGRLSHNSGIASLTHFLYLILPDLSRLDLKNDAVYGLQALPNSTTLIISAGYGLLYSIMLLAVATLIFSQREF
jgi:ABC-type transport system involved in multi-copper enzyme maturation permease subunit